MLGRMTVDAQLRRLLQPLMSVRHAHLRPLQAMTSGSRRLSLHYGDPEACSSGCEGLLGALRAVHAAGLWVGDLSKAISFDERGRVTLTGVGTAWDLIDPFADHPSAGAPDLRVRWRQRADLLQLRSLPDHLVACA